MVSRGRRLGVVLRVVTAHLRVMFVGMSRMAVRRVGVMIRCLVVVIGPLMRNHRYAPRRNTFA